VRKHAYFPSWDFESWPEPRDIELDGTDHLPLLDPGRSNIRLFLKVHPIFAMLLQWSK